MSCQFCAEFPVNRCPFCGQTTAAPIQEESLFWRGLVARIEAGQITRSEGVAISREWLGLLAEAKARGLS